MFKVIRRSFTARSFIAEDSYVMQQSSTDLVIRLRAVDEPAVRWQYYSNERPVRFIPAGLIVDYSWRPEAGWRLVKVQLWGHALKKDGRPGLSERQNCQYGYPTASETWPQSVFDALDRTNPTGLSVSVSCSEHSA